MDYRQIKAIEFKNKQRIKKQAPTAADESGIYIFHRQEDGIKFAYVGQAKKVLTRLAQHLQGYEQHIDRSLKKHGLAAEKAGGYEISIIYCAENELDEKEREYIRRAAAQGFQLRNKTIGGQNAGKVGMNENAPSKGYRDGLKQGYKNAQKDVRKLFEKNLTFAINGTPNKNKEKALDKFRDFLEDDR